MNLTEFSKEIHKDNLERGFYQPYQEIKQLIQKENNEGLNEAHERLFSAQRYALIMSEVSEALEAERSNRYLENYDNFETKPDEVEEWKIIDTYPDYEVSNLGRIRSLDMKVWSGKNYYTKTGRILTPGLGGTGYYTVALRGDSQKVAILVGKAFVEGYKEGLYINHINGIKTDDYANNLEWTTPQENAQHAHDSGLVNSYRILSKDDTIKIAFMAKSKIPHKKINEQFPQISLSRIKAISRNHEKITECMEFELADIIIRVLDYAGFKGIDIQKHVQYKLEYNKTRGIRHQKAY